MAVIQEYEESNQWATGEHLTYIYNSYSLFHWKRLVIVFQSLFFFSCCELTVKVLPRVNGMLLFIDVSPW